MSQLGEEVKAWRLDRGFTQMKAARVLGVPHSCIQALESGRRRIVQEKDLKVLAEGMDLTEASIRCLLPYPGFTGRWIPIQ